MPRALDHSDEILHGAGEDGAAECGERAAARALLMHPCDCNRLRV